jgi:hypothetical protein
MGAVMFRTTLLILLLFFLTVSTSAAQEVGDSEEKYRAISDLGNIYELSIETGAVEVMKPVPVTIKVSNKDGALIPEAKISCSLTMPAMAMPSNKPPIKESDEIGQYEGVILLTMGGLWHVEISVVYKAGQQDFVLIPIAGLSSGQSQDKNVDSKLEELFKAQDNGKEQ